MTDKDDCFSDRMMTLWAEIDSARNSVEAEIKRARGRTKETLEEVSESLLDASESLPGLP